MCCKVGEEVEEVVILLDKALVPGILLNQGSIFGGQNLGCATGLLLLFGIKSWLACAADRCMISSCLGMHNILERRP